MDTKTCINKYCQLAKDIFPQERLFAKLELVKLGKAMVSKPRFDAAILESKVQELITDSLDLGSRNSNAENLKLDFEASSEGDMPTCKV